MRPINLFNPHATSLILLIFIQSIQLDVISLLGGTVKYARSGASFPYTLPRSRPASTINKWRYQASDRRVSLTGMPCGHGFSGRGVRLRRLRLLLLQNRMLSINCDVDPAYARGQYTQKHPLGRCDVTPNPTCHHCKAYMSPLLGLCDASSAPGVLYPFQA